MRRARVSELPTFVPVPADGVYTREWLDAFFAGDRAGFVEDLRAVAAALPCDSQPTTDAPAPGQSGAKSA